MILAVFMQFTNPSCARQITGEERLALLRDLQCVIICLAFELRLE